MCYAAKITKAPEFQLHTVLPLCIGTFPKMNEAGEKHMTLLTGLILNQTPNFKWALSATE